jgi:hypothetical protein
MMPRQKFALSALERSLLAFYSTVPVYVRAQIGQVLLEAWTRPSAAEREANEGRRKASWRRFKMGTVRISTFDDLRAGEEQKRRTTVPGRGAVEE